MKLINDLYYMVETQFGHLDMQTQAEKELTAQRYALEDEMRLRLGEGGEELMEAYADVGLKLETIHDQTLFRAAVRLGTELARPAGPHSTSR